MVILENELRLYNRLEDQDGGFKQNLVHGHLPLASDLFGVLLTPKKVLEVKGL